MWGLRNPMPATAGREAEEWIVGMRLTFRGLAFRILERLYALGSVLPPVSLPHEPDGR